jgi:uncharacterized membrane protein
MGNDTSGTSFFWTKATGIREIPIPSSFATGINRGFVIGASSCLKPSQCDVNNLHAFIWHRHLGAFDLGTLPGDNSSVPSGINFILQVVGASQNNATGASTAFFVDSRLRNDRSQHPDPRSRLGLELRHKYQ